MTMCDALGIINFEDSTAAVSGLDDYRPVPAISFMGRYRIIDFILSNMTNSGISQIQVYCKEKPRSLIEHLGTGLHYNINSKRGRLRILYGEKNFTSQVYNHDVANFMLNMQYIEGDSQPYVIVAPSYFIYSIDFNEVMRAHLDSKADVTVLYTSTDQAKESFLGCDELTLDKDKRIVSIEKNYGKRKSALISMEAYVMTKKLFIELVKKAAETSALYWFRDILIDSLPELNIKGYSVKGFVECLNTLPAYYRVSMELRDRGVANGLFKPNWPIYTITNDSCPTRYTPDAHASKSVVSNGCIIEGSVEGSVLGRNVTVMKGAIVKNSVLLPGAFIGENVKLDHCVVDKNAIVHHVKALAGTDEDPIYVKRSDRI